jgi:hypothetical protein
MVPAYAVYFLKTSPHAKLSFVLSSMFERLSIKKLAFLFVFLTFVVAHRAIDADLSLYRCPFLLRPQK